MGSQMKDFNFSGRLLLSTIAGAVLLSTLVACPSKDDSANVVSTDSRVSSASREIGQSGRENVPAPPAAPAITTDLKNKSIEVVPLGANDTAASGGLIQAISKPTIEGVTHPYNASIMEYDGQFLMTVRMDTGEKDPEWPVTKIGIVKLDQNLNQVSKTLFVQTGSRTAEDTRIFRKGDELWITYNARRGNQPLRAMYIAKLPKLDFEANQITVSPVLLDFDSDRNQKNWVPFVHDGNIYFSYSLFPHKVLRYDEASQKTTVAFETDSHDLSARWGFGHIRGGTPAILHGNEYLSFFHSSDLKNGNRWYVFGAYTFEARPPFKITRVYEKPIYFSDNFVSFLQPFLARDWQNRVVFPSGFAKRGDSILLSYGENDSQTKIVALDEKKLFANFAGQHLEQPPLTPVPVLLALPPALEKVPLMDDGRVVKNVRRIVLNDEATPSKGSLLPTADGFLFAYKALTAKRHTEIRLASLNKNFIQVGPSQVVRIDLPFLDDPRLLQVGQKVILTVVANNSANFEKGRMVIAEIKSPAKGSGSFQVLADSHILGKTQGIEKMYQPNWIPFASKDALRFAYVTKENLAWNLGEILGGTPAVKWGKENLAAFYSSFSSGSMKWSVMGLYTFDDKEPFTIRRVLKVPMMARDFYTTLPGPYTDKNSKSLIPCGLFIKDGTIYISYGENDSAVKVLELNESAVQNALSPLGQNVELKTISAP